jgi:uncharacterized membrane protein
MTLLLVGLLLFVGAHSVSIVADGWRDAMVAKLGDGAWKGAYSLVSGVGMALMVYGYSVARASPAVLYVPPAGLRHLSFLVMLPVFPLFFAAYLPGRIRTATQHPMLLGTLLWGVAHLMVNGMAADVALFGGVAAWALADRISLSRRTPRALAMAPEGPLNDAIAVVGGLVTYAVVLMWAHRALIGISPLG